MNLQIQLKNPHDFDKIFDNKLIIIRQTKQYGNIHEVSYQPYNLLIGFMEVILLYFTDFSITHH